MRAIAFRVGKRPEVIDIENSLEALQAFVGGYIEHVSMPGGAAIICDEEGKLKGKTLNSDFRRFFSYPVNDVLVGDFLVVRDGPNGEFVDVTDADVARYGK